MEQAKISENCKNQKLFKWNSYQRSNQGSDAL